MIPSRVSSYRTLNRMCSAAMRRVRYGIVARPTTTAVIRASEAVIAVPSRFPWSRKLVESTAKANENNSPSSAMRKRTHASASTSAKNLANLPGTRNSPSLATPQEKQSDDCQDREDELQIVELAHEPLPTAAEEISERGHDRNPEHRAEEVEEHEFLPWHLKYAGER